MNEQTREQKMDAARVRMAELAAKFLDRSDGDVASMRSGLGRMAAGDATAVGDIQHLAHRMAGTGATLGFESVSDAAHRLEKLAEGCARGASPDDATRARFAEAVEALAAELHKHRGG